MIKTKDTPISFSGQHFYVGIDVHKKRWSVAIRQNDMRLRNYSMDPSPDLLVSQLMNHFPDGVYHLVYEVGFTGFWICRRFRELGLDCIVVNPADIPTAHKEKDRKSDPLDANKLARELENGNLVPLYVPSESEQNLRSLCRLYRTTVQSNTRVKNRIKAHLAFNGIQIDRESSYWSGDFIAYLRNLPLDEGPSRSCLNILLNELDQHRQRLADVLKELRSWIRHGEIGRIVDNIRSVPGIGFKTGMILYTEIVDIRRFKRLDHLKSYAGLVPSTYSSGERDRTRGLTNRRNTHLRYVLIEAAWVAIRKDQVLLHTYNELTQKMHKQEAIVRIAGKLLSRIRYVWMNDCHYVPGIIQ